MENFNILICYPGDRHEDCQPIFFTSLDNLDEHLLNIFKNWNDILYLYILIPNKKVTFNSTDDCDFIISSNYNITELCNKLYNIFLKKMID